MKNQFDAGFDRRRFVGGGLGLLGATAITGPFQALSKTAAAGVARKSEAGYGELRPVKDDVTGLPLLRLPEGFRYRTFGWTGDAMSDGHPTPPAHDGMAVIAAEGNLVTLARNHEQTSDTGAFGDASKAYDPTAIGGVTKLVFDTAKGELVDSRVGLNGTIQNCAGGPTPWGSWLSCEETIYGPGDEVDGRKLDLAKTHGWIFEVPADRESDAQPLEEMGRFVHEAIAVDPRDGIVYETEDRDTAGLYRYLPNEPGKLAAGGKLEMLKVRGREDVRKGVAVGATFDIAWVPIEDPRRAHSPGKFDALGVYYQGKDQGGTTFARLEGCYYADGRVFLAATSGGDAGVGQVWELDIDRQTIKLIFESPKAEVLDHPDNVTVSPRGGIVLCEDGDYYGQRLQGLTRDGYLFPFAQNDILLRGERNGYKGDFRPQEWAGVSFSPDGKWLFANIQTPGITFAITGPWETGVL